MFDLMCVTWKGLPVSNRAFDVIVAGSGHNGLVAAAYLAKAGLKVQVLEAHAIPGGMTSTAPVEDMPGYLVNEASIQPSLFRTTTIMKDLELGSKYGLKMQVIDPVHLQLNYDHSSLALWRDAQRTADELKHWSKKDAESLLTLYRVVHAAVDIGIPMMQTNPVRPDPKAILKAAARTLKHRKELVAVGRWMRCTQLEALEDTFESDPIKACLLIGLPFMSYDSDISGWSLIYMGIITKFGVAMFEGGTGELPKALIRVIEDNGGSVRTSAEVEELVVRGGRVTGVRLKGGEELAARRGVLTAFSPKRVLRDLLPAGTLSPRLENRVRHIPTRSRGFSDLKLDVLTRGKIRMDKVEQWRGDGIDCRLPANGYHTYEQVKAAQLAAKRGEIPEHTPGLMQIGTALPANRHHAPEGCDTAWFWSGLAPNDPQVGWDAAREQITTSIISDADHYYEGLEELDVFHRIRLMPDIEERFFAEDGSVYHVDPLITRFGPLKPAAGFAGYSTPVPGLFLTGSGTHPVAGISGMPGQNAARTMLKVFKREDKKGRAAHAVEEAKEWDRVEEAAVPAPEAGPAVEA
ncbi:MAG: crtI2 [Solirubrobacterales bacterium]|nr:crtI2 [Solirubrobacterales bacterium]